MRRPLGWLAIVTASVLSVAGAHATLVIGTMTFEPDPLTSQGTVSVSVALEDPGLVEVEDAVIFLELRSASGNRVLDENEQPGGEALHVTDRLEETAPGLYQTELPVPSTGPYTLSVRDRTYRQEEAVANLQVDFGSELGEVVFVLPPTDTGPASLGTWLIWLIVVPLIAGVVVTVLVLRGGKDEAPEDAESVAGGPPRDEAAGADEDADSSR